MHGDSDRNGSVTFSSLVCVLLSKQQSALLQLTVLRYDSATIRARAFRLSFISLISLSTSSMNLCGRARGLVRKQSIPIDGDKQDVLDDKVDKLVLEHGLGMEVGDEERNVISLSYA